jgi:DNA/RNA endonuclease YhcR with UshA esterase domain
MQQARFGRITVGLTIACLAVFIGVGYWNNSQFEAAAPTVIPTTSTTTTDPAPAAVQGTINQLSLISVGQRLILEGTLITAEDFSAGKRFTLDDGTGTITLLLWQELVDTLPDPNQLTPGTRVRVTGTIEEFNAGLEIIPASAGDILVLQ